MKIVGQNLFCPLAHQPTPVNTGETGSEWGILGESVCSYPEYERADGCFSLHLKPMRERLHVTTWKACCVSPGAWGTQGLALLHLKRSIDEKPGGVVGSAKAKRASLGMACTSTVTWFKMVVFLSCGPWVNLMKSRYSSHFSKGTFLVGQSGRDEVPQEKGWLMGQILRDDRESSQSHWRRYFPHQGATVGSFQWADTWKTTEVAHKGKTQLWVSDMQRALMPRHKTPAKQGRGLSFAYSPPESSPRRGGKSKKVGKEQRRKWTETWAKSEEKQPHLLSSFQAPGPGESPAEAWDQQWGGSYVGREIGALISEEMGLSKYSESQVFHQCLRMMEK